MVATTPSFAAAMRRVARMRRCSACGSLLAPESLACPGCERVVICPHSDAWPRSLKRHTQVLLIQRHTRALRTEAGEISDAGWRRLLLGNYRGEWIGTGPTRRLVPMFTASADDIYPWALQAAEQWEASRGE